MGDEYYPDHLLPVIREQEVRYRRFAELREQVLLEYGYNTARAYWGDLEDVFRWAVERDKDVLALTEKDVKQYIALLRRRKYSHNTIRRHVTTLRKLYDELISRGHRNDNPAKRVIVTSVATKPNAV
ncbi:site-specific integrase [Rhodococcus sp. ACS1]|uniref:site-specific integrase n=1 Tax=Rhodococcus sp. ACS1 TaxID=2028570 RepID=UPI0015CB27EB|nr:site-specific integrase [Rhodococcus sp. ACS1]